MLPWRRPGAPGPRDSAPSRSPELQRSSGRLLPTSEPHISWTGLDWTLPDLQCDSRLLSNDSLINAKHKIGTNPHQYSAMASATLNTSTTCKPESGYKFGYSKTTTSSHSSRTIHTDAAFVIPHIQPHYKILDVGSGPGTITIGFAP